jgi:hypothetical protein
MDLKQPERGVEPKEEVAMRKITGKQKGSEPQVKVESVFTSLVRYFGPKAAEDLIALLAVLSGPIPRECIGELRGAIARATCGTRAEEGTS